MKSTAALLQRETNSHQIKRFPEPVTSTQGTFQLFYDYIIMGDLDLVSHLFSCFKAEKKKRRDLRTVKAKVPTWPAERFGNFTVVQLLQHTRAWDFAF